MRRRWRSQGRQGHHLGETGATEAVSLVWLAPSYLEHVATSQEVVKKFDFFYAYCAQYHEHYASDADDLERNGLLKKSKATVREAECF